MTFALPAGLFRTFAHAAAPLAVAALWQGVMIAVGLATYLRFAPRISAVHRFAVWSAGFAVVASLPLLPEVAHFAGGLFTASAAGNATGSAGASPHAWFQLDDRWTFAIAGLWLLLSAFRATGLALHAFRLRRLWNSTEPIGAELALPLKAITLAEICTTSKLDRPSVIGFFAPRILIPDWLLAKLTSEELEQVVLHETEHLRRRDDWTNLLQKLCLVLSPLNPALAWMDHRLAREREMACDEGVVRATGAPRAYAACLASLAGRGLENNRDFARRAEALSLGAFERRPELVQRVHSILFSKTRLNPIAARALLGTVGCGLLFGAVELTRCPQLVAFVPAATPVAQFTAAVPQIARPAIPGFRAVNTMAVMTAAPLRAIYHRPSALRTQPAHESSPAASSLLASAASPRQQLLKAEAVDLRAAAQPEPQQWIVLTSWQQVEAPAARSGRVADYDTGTEQQSSNAPTSQVTVTRLILRVYPASSSPLTASPTEKSASPVTKGEASDTNSTPKPVLNLPAVPFGDGWLVIQL